VAPFLCADAVQALWRDARAGRASRRLAYTIIVLLLWLERHALS
jgi:asparagine synthase (glutamine-hydrolysing)